MLFSLGHTSVLKLGFRTFGSCPWVHASNIVSKYVMLFGWLFQKSLWIIHALQGQIKFFSHELFCCQPIALFFFWHFLCLSFAFSFTRSKIYSQVFRNGCCSRGELFNKVIITNFSRDRNQPVLRLLSQRFFRAVSMKFLVIFHENYKKCLHGDCSIADPSFLCMKDKKIAGKTSFFPLEIVLGLLHFRWGSIHLR